MAHPPRLSRTTLACLLFLFATVESASKCTVGCHGMHPSKAYQEGHTYVYDLNGMSVTSVTDAQGDATLKMSATVELSVKPNCVHQLRLKNVQFNGAPSTLPDVEQYGIQFNYHDGHIDTEICTEPGDSQASLNIKRAVASMFQSAVMQESGTTTHHETDVMGACPTEFSFRKEGDSTIVQKNKNLAQCSYRENVNQGLISASVDTAAGISASPLLGSQQEIQQRFKRGILNKAVSRESYKLKPFSNGNAGASTSVETTLTLKSEKEDNPPAPVSLPKSLIFEAPHPVVKSSADDIINALKATKAEVASGVKPEAANKFADLVKVLRLSSKNDILSVYQKIKQGAGFDKEDQKLFLDTLFRAGSGEAAEVGVELVKNKEISGVQEMLFYASLALIRHVNKPSVAAITSLLDQPKLPRLGYLGVGHVIGKYCQEHSCENVPEVKEAVHKIREKVGNGKVKTREQENLVVSALKALGNTGFLDDATLQKLANIAADKNVRNRVRVAALDALPNRCTMKWKNIAFKVLADREEDTEVRIKTYLALVACPCPHVASQLKEILDKETVNQVGSFIQTHLRNLRASTDPNKLAAKNQLGLIKPRTKFPEDFRKFSFNEELSYKIDAFGVGSSYESNVIYSQNSFVPRSTTLNMTMELFGRSFNFLELDTRVENLDRVIERYFGPKGQLWKRNLEDLKNTGASTAANLGKYIQERYEKSLRGKREVKQGELDKFAKNVHLRGNEVDQDLDLDLTVKLFGVELAYLSYQGDSNKLSPEAIVDKVFEQLEKGFNVVKNLNYDLENYMQFLDAELVYPTSMGASLNLGVTGTSVLRVKTSGKLDIPAILKDPKNANFRIALEPSVSVTIAGKMRVQGVGVESGMKLVSTLHTASSTDMTVSVLDGKGVDVNFGIPKKKQELISVSSDVLLSSGPKGEEYVAPKFGKGKEHADCFDQFSTILGLTVCGQISYPYEDLATIQKKPLFPLSGPAKFAVTVENNDVNSYHFKVYLNTEDPNKRSFEILLDTPNSKTNRRVSLNLEAATEPNKYVKLSVESPVKKISLEAVLKNNPQERTFTITAFHDQMEYYGRIGALASGSKYKPVLEYRVPEHIEKLASAKTGLQSGQQYNVQGTIDVSDYQGGQKYVLDKVTLLVGGKKLMVIDGSASATPTAINVDTNLGYGDKNLALKLDGKKVADNNYALTVSAMPSTDPTIGFKLDWEFKGGKNEMQNKLVFVHGPDPNSETNRLSLNQNAVLRLDPKNLLLSTSNELTYPALNMKLKLEGELTRKSISTDIEVKYEKFNFGTELSATKDMEKPGDYEAELEVELMENSVELKSKRTVVDPQKSKFANSLVLKPGGKYEADATVTHDVSKNNINIQLDGDVNLNGKKVKVDTGLAANPQSINSRVFVKVDGVKYVEFLLKTRKTPNPSGTLTLNLKNYLATSGQYTYQNHKGNANLNIDIPKINRKIKANGDLAISGSEHVGNFEVLYDAEKDPTKRVKLSTISDITKNSVDTKNVLEILTYKLELNAKGKLEGTNSDCQLQVDMDTTLPNGRYLVYKLKRNSAKKDNKYNIQVDSEIVDSVKKGGPSRKLAYISNIKDLDLQDRTHQKLSAQLKYVNMDGKDTQIAWNGKNFVQPDNNRVNEFNIEVGGANIPKKFQFQMSSTCGNNEGAYKAKSSLGDDFSLMSSGTLNQGNKIDKPYKVEGVLDMKLPSDKLSNLKLEISSSMLESDENNLMEYSDALKLTYNNDKTIQTDSHLKLQMSDKDPNEASSGTGKMTLNVLQYPPLKLEGNYKYVPNPEKRTAMVDLNASYGDKKLSVRSDNEYLPELAVVNLKAKGNKLLEKLQNVNLDLTYKRYKPENKLVVDSVLTADGNKYTLNSEVQHQSTNNVFHLTTSCPSGKTEVLSKFQKLGDKEYKGQWKVDTPKGFAVADAHVDLENVDNFVINANFDSDKFKHRKIHAEIANKPTAKAGKRIVITVTSDGQNIVTGSTSYKKRDEDGKIVVEGNGNLKVGDDTKSSSFKYTRQQLTHEKDGEVGVAMVLNANFGPSAIVGELKLSNKEVHVFNSYCEQNKDCAHFKLQSTLDVEQKTLLKHQITVEVDLKKFNVPAEFGLKTSTEFNKPIFDHTTNLYLHSTKDKSEYTYQAYIHPKEAATILSLPAREMAIVLTYDLPKTKHSGAYKMDLSLYLDRKNKPSDKTSLSASGDINVDKNSLSLSGETKFTYPTQPKDMLVKGRLHCCTGDNLLDAIVDIDVFAKKSQKITIWANVKRQPIPDGTNVTGVVEMHSRGQLLKLDLKSHLAVSKTQAGFGTFFTYNDVNQKPKTLGALYSMDLNHIFLLVTLPDKELIRDDWKMEFSKNLQKIDREVSVLGEMPIVVNLEANDLNRFKFQVYPKDKPNNKLSVNGQVVLGQLAEVHADLFKDGAKNDLFHVLVHLDEKQFLKPDFGYQKDNVAEVLEIYKNRNIELAKKMKDVHEYVVEQVQAEGTDLLEHLKKAQPNLKPLMDYYQGELDKMKDEVNADETVKEIQATLNKYFGALVAAVTETMKQVAEGLNKLQQQLNSMMANVKEAIRSTYPQLKASYDKIFHEFMEILDSVAKLLNTYLKAILNIINEHQKEIQDVMSVVSGMTQDFAKIVSKGLEQINRNLEEFGAMLVNQLKALPIYEVAKQKYQELQNYQLPEMIINPVEEFCKVMYTSLPTEELRQFSDVACQYVLKHVKHEKQVDEMAELKKLYSHAITAIQSVLNLLQKQASFDNVLNFSQVQTPIDFSFLSKLPGISTLRISVLNLLRNQELPSPLDLYYAYRPTLYPSDILPPFSKSAVVTDGGHFFTFDGRHLTLPGTCTYILAQDMQDGNFSIVGNFNNGNLISVTVTEPKESITLKNNGNLLVNNKPADYPASTKNLHAYLMLPTFTNVKSDYGVRVTCTDRAPMVCAIHVSGFYLGKLRGLLGDGNNEPYDDYTLPSGKITESGSDFGNAYKLKGDCPDTAAVEHKDRAPLCTDYFTSESSPLKPCFNYVNPANYRDACDYAVATNAPEGACIIATAYHYTCYAQGVMSTRVPPACTTCKVGENKIEVGDTFSVKVPKKEADIVFVVEQQIPNDKVFKELVTPLMSELREELKQQGVTDVHIGLIGFSESMKWPQHYTVNGNTNIEGEVKNIKFLEKKPSVTLEEAKEGDTGKKLEYLLQKMNVELGTFRLTDAYEEAIRYPFRAGAAKAVIGIIANPCEKSPFPISLQQIRLLLGLKMYRDLGLTFHHVSYPNELLVSGKPQKNIVGYDQDSVYTFADSKKKPLSGSSDTKNNLAVPVNDVCADFALSSGGAAFSSDNFLDAKPNQKKQFVQVAARRVVDGLVNVELQKDCTCDYQFGFLGRTQCKIVGRNEAPARSTKGGAKG